MRPFSLSSVVFGAMVLFVVPLTVVAQETGRDSASPRSQAHQPMSLAQADSGSADKSSGAEHASAPAASGGEDYREVSDFFNIREANPQVDKGEWEFEFESRWFTRSNGKDDEFGLAQTLKYGITDTFFVELEVVEPSLGDGRDQGNGDLNLILFNRFVRESGSMPAIAGFVEMRIPTGQGSSGVDASFNGIVTKSITDRLRAHLEGYVETANGEPAGDQDDRRHFQWGVGPGFDYKIDEQTLVLLNYINRSSEEYGHHNENVLEFGGIREIYHQGDIHQHVKLAVDIGLDGQAENDNFGAKFQYSIDWR